MSILYSLFYSLAIGCLFVYLFIYTYDFFYGEKHEKQLKKIYKYFRSETITKVDILEHDPKKFTIYQVVTDTGKKKIKIKPGYKIIKLVAKK
ncbi:hypothetical protein [Neobacillus sp. PS3-40]|uniref:hypothetical protein n=1 Tax=Neobacillus sp. PS3-40 TaxID=3070679 RepID=UPI0027E04142|nr:hypothetical protein [Neobacillus sp. PS3-40]WML44470.1 hypothetical protein RCG20_00710 [Neobacillus sp. PS3-40]